MSAFEAFVAFLVEHGVALLVGTTIVLGAFALLVLCRRSLPQQHRLAGTAMFAVAAYVVVALVPLPRWSPGESGTEAAANVTAPPQTGPREPAPAETAAEAPETVTADAAEPPATDTRETTEVLDTPLVPAVPGPEEERARPTLIAHADSERTAAEPPAEAAPFPWRGVAGGAFAIGALLFYLQLLAGWWRLRRVLRNTSAAPAEVQALVPLPRRARIRIADQRVQPFCVGTLRPTIVLPRHLANATDETRFVLLHERAHLDARDPATRLVAALLRPLLFWHPLYWWLQRKLRFTGELLADDAAASGSVAQYVRCMMTLSTHPDPVAGDVLAATIFRRRSELFRRLEMMLQRDETITRSQSRTSRLARVAATTLLVGLCAGAFGVERAVAQNPHSEHAQAQMRELKEEISRLRAQISDLQEYTRQTTRANRAGSAKSPRAVPDGFPSGRSGGVASAPRGTTSTASGRGSTAPNRSYNTYKVKKGDTLAQIARRHYGDTSRTDLILKDNPKLDARRLRAGQRIKLRNPRPESYDSFGTVPEPRAARAPREARTTRAPQEPAAPTATAAVPRPAATATAPQAYAALPGQNRPGYPGQPTATAPSPRRPSNPLAASGRAPRAVGTAARHAPTARRSQPRATGQAHAPRADSLASLADMMTRCIELRGEIEIAKVDIDCAENERDRRVAKIRMRTTEEQLDAVRTMLKTELETAQMNLAHTAKLHDKGFVGEHEVRAAERHVAMLERALR